MCIIILIECGCTMSRKLFCEISPTTYKISLEKEIVKRNIKNLIGKEKIAKTISKEELPVIVKGHSSILIRKLNGVDIKLQSNKVTNIELACKKINGLVIHPGETFSYWITLGRPTYKKGFKDGLVISKNGMISGVGGGLCQMANMIHFGTGTSVAYNNVDYRFKNNTDCDVQILVWIESGELCGELRSEKEFPYRYKLVEENHHFKKEGDIYYRISQVYRIVIDKKTNEEVKKELILDNHSKVMYDYSLIPVDQIRND